MVMEITFLRSPDEATPAQLDAYNILVELGAGVHRMEEIRDRLGLRSILPVRSRLEHLAAKGIIAIS
jgi:hypothetical protein